MQIKDLSMSFGVQELFSDINLYIGEKEKVGVVGVNGVGKSTFFKIVMGIVEPDRGKIILEGNSRVDWLPQIIEDEILDKEITVLDFLLLGRPIDKLNKELQIAYSEVAKIDDEKEQQVVFKRIEKIQKKLEYWECYSAESTLLKIIAGMGITDTMLDQKVSNLSGGQKSKVAFAKLLYSMPEIILLDEPTNHLDKESKDYVINFLKKYKGSVFIISHDIDFLNQVTTKILLLDKRSKSFELYDGNYDKFKKLYIERENSIKRQALIQRQEEEKLRTLIMKYSGVSGKRKKMAQDREKKLERLLENKIEITPEYKKAKIEMISLRDSSNVPLKVSNISFKYKKDSLENVVDNVSFELSKGEKFLIVGENGIGKSTLLKLIVGQLVPDKGLIEIGNKTDIVYYAQEHELLDNSKNIIDNFRDINISIRQLRNVLGRFLFYGDDVFKQVGVLSPGERSRVALAKLSLLGSNFLVLDEPTNHLDPETQIIIAETFKTFTGTMLVVSHNPEFVDNLGISRTLILPSGKISYYDKDVVKKYNELNNKNKSVK